jgi:hypothetical protein
MSEIDDKTERAFQELRRMKDQKKKGKIILHLDGSGKVAKVEKSEYI